MERIDQTTNKNMYTFWKSDYSYGTQMKKTLIRFYKEYLIPNAKLKRE